jgi:hypothetical protein
MVDGDKKAKPLRVHCAECQTILGKKHTFGPSGKPMISFALHRVSGRRSVQRFLPKLLVNVAGFNARLTWKNFVNDWMYLQTWGTFLYAAWTKEVHQKHEIVLMRKYQSEPVQVNEQTLKQLCIVTGGRLSIGKFYNKIIFKKYIFSIYISQVHTMTMHFKL